MGVAVQGGVDEGSNDAGLVSLGSLYYEPLWLFHRADQPLASLRDLSGHRVAVGESGIASCSA